MIGRRDFLKAFSLGVAAVSTGMVSGRALAMEQEPFVLDMQRNRDRYLIDLRTEEGYRVAAWLLRDIEAGNILGVPNMNTLRLAAWAQAWAAANNVFTVLNIHSGLRLPTTNASIEGAAQKSQHLPDQFMRFSAIDLDPYGLDRRVFGNMVARARFGGVGWYKTHIHFDSRGRPAYWRKGV